MKLFFNLLFLFTTLPIFCQNTEIWGKIYDSENKEGIPFPLITDIKGEYLGVGNKDGEYTLVVNKTPQTIIFSCTGYEAVKVQVNKDLQLPKNIYLRPNIQYLSEVIIHPSKLLSEQLGTLEVPIGTPTLSFGQWDYTAFSNKYKLENQPSKIESASVFIGRNTVGNFTLRCRITEVKNGRPGNDLLQQNVIVNSEIEVGWVKFDLSPYNLWIDDKSIFLIIEVLQDFEISEHTIITHKPNTPGFTYLSGKGNSLISTSPNNWMKNPKFISTNLKISYANN